MIDLARSAVRQSFRIASGTARRAADMRLHLAEFGSALGGLYQYYSRGDVSTRARASVLKLHCKTNGRSTDQLASLLRLARPARPAANVDGFLGKLTIAKQNEIVEAIARNGFHVFDQRLPAEICDEIAHFASVTPAQVEGRPRHDRILFDAAAPVSKTYRVVEEDIVTNPSMQRLMADPSVLAVAERYLRTLPILSMVNLWWSPTFGDRPGADAAQEFHFDFDPPPIWLLFFVYLTDVGPNNGPHVYARGSHRAGHPAAAPLLKRGYVRIPDNEIASAFGQENVVELCGKRGTILAVDTRGFHKGKMLSDGHRLMVQLTFSCPPFSGSHGRRQPLPPDPHPELAAALAKTPNVFERYR
jgi:hypothetical protein